MKKRKNLKGFTLIELIIVMAIFGIIMTAVLQVINPLHKLSKRASIQEANSAVVDNMKNYFEGTLRYADCIEVAVGGPTDNNGNKLTDITSLAQNFVKNHYNNRVNDGADGTGTGGDHLKGIVRVLKINNNIEKDFTDPTKLVGGAVTEYVYEFEAGCRYQKEGTDPPEYGFVEPKITSKNVKQVFNPVYYDDYAFYFVPGYNQMTFRENIPKSTDYKSAVQKITAANGAQYPEFSKDMFSLSVITYKNDLEDVLDADGNPTGKQSISNHEKVGGEDIFTTPFQLSNINMSLVNINSTFSTTKVNDLYGPDWILKTGASKPTVYDENGSTKFRAIENADAPKIGSRLFVHPAPADGSDDDCIYFIYTLPEYK